MPHPAQGSAGRDEKNEECDTEKSGGAWIQIVPHVEVSVEIEISDLMGDFKANEVGAQAYFRIAFFRTTILRFDWIARPSSPFGLHALSGSVGKNLGAWRNFVACSKAYASLISVGSL